MKNIIFSIFVLFAISCAGTDEILISGNISPAERSSAKKEITGILEMNKLPDPANFHSKIGVTGFIDGKPIAADGEVYFRKNPLAGKIVIKDLIFRSPLVFVLADEDKIQIHSVLDNTLYVTHGNITKPNFYENSNSYAMLGYIATGKVPVILNASVTGYSEEKNIKAIILENSGFKETIYKKDGVPAKILFENKKTSEKIEIKYDNYVTIEGYGFFKKIAVKTYSNGNSINFSYSGINLNKVVNNSIFRLDMPGDTKIINLN